MLGKSQAEQNEQSLLPKQASAVCLMSHKTNTHPPHWCPSTWAVSNVGDAVTGPQWLSVARQFLRTRLGTSVGKPASARRSSCGEGVQ